MKFKRGLTLYVVQILAIYGINTAQAAAKSVSSIVKVTMRNT